jgi:hypothetical protein
MTLRPMAKGAVEDVRSAAQFLEEIGNGKVRGPAWIRCIWGFRDHF